MIEPQGGKWGLDSGKTIGEPMTAGELRVLGAMYHQMRVALGRDLTFEEKAGLRSRVLESRSVREEWTQ